MLTIPFSSFAIRRRSEELQVVIEGKSLACPHECKADVREADGAVQVHLARRLRLLEQERRQQLLLDVGVGLEALLPDGRSFLVGAHQPMCRHTCVHLWRWGMSRSVLSAAET